MLRIASNLSLEQLAHKISQILNISLQKDIDGRYEEIPAYFTEALGLRVALLDYHHLNHQYELHVSPQNVAYKADFDQIAWVDLGPWLEANFQDETEFKVEMRRRPIPPSGVNMG
jgi:hypothetical protein